MRIGARAELRRQMREQRRVRTIALVVVVVALLGAPMLYLGILFATRDPVLNSLDRLGVPSWAAQSPEDRIITGSRWCFIDCRLRERTMLSERDPQETTAVYHQALQNAGWVRWEVAGCPLVEVDGDYSCWTRDEYTLDLWVRPPDCAYDPLVLRPDLTDEDGEADPPPDGDPDPEDSEDPEACGGSVVEVKMQNRVADQRGVSGLDGNLPGEDGGPSGPPASGPPATGAPEDEDGTSDESDPAGDSS